MERSASGSALTEHAAAPSAAKRGTSRAPLPVATRPCRSLRADPDRLGGGPGHGVRAVAEGDGDGCRGGIRHREHGVETDAGLVECTEHGRVADR